MPQHWKMIIKTAVIGGDKRREAYVLQVGKTGPHRISTHSLAYSSDINSLLQHCICSIGLCMHGSPNEDLKMQLLLKQKNVTFLINVSIT